MTSVLDAPRLDEQLRTVSHPARRQLLVALVDEHPYGSTPLNIAEWVADTDTAESLITMYHAHLPKLEDCGYIRWDRDNRLVTRGPQFAEIKSLLTVLSERQNELPDE